MYIIVGIDSGKTAAIACLDLNGDALFFAHERFAGVRWFVDTIKGVGKPVVIAGDKAEPGRVLSKIAAVFGSELYTPRFDISTEKKKEMAEKTGIRNVHEKDAFAAAKTAYNAYANKFRQVDRLATSKGIGGEEVKAMVVKKYSVYEALSGRKANRRYSGI